MFQLSVQHLILISFFRLDYRLIRLRNVTDILIQFNSVIRYDRRILGSRQKGRRLILIQRCHSRIGTGISEMCTNLLSKKKELDETFYCLSSKHGTTLFPSVMQKIEIQEIKAHNER
jgi:hypothetical protein